MAWARHGRRPRLGVVVRRHAGSARRRPGSSHLHAYVVAKFGLRDITKSAAMELASHHIRVNSIHPGLVHTPPSRGVADDGLTSYVPVKT